MPNFEFGRTQGLLLVNLRRGGLKLLGDLHLSVEIETPGDLVKGFCNPARKKPSLWNCEWVTAIVKAKDVIPVTALIGC